LSGRMDKISVPRSISEHGDEEVIDELQTALNAAEENCAGGTCTLPETQHLQVRIGYDDGFNNHLGGASKAEAYIAAIWTHLQVNYCHSSLGSKVLVERLPGIKHYTGKKLKGNGKSLKKMYSHTDEDLGSADLMLYMGFDGPNWSQGGGIAYGPVVCEPGYNKYKQSINCYGTSHSDMGALLAHEIGHNLGMEHDFDQTHGGNGGPCNGQGIMSYGEPPLQWSECSVKDFTAHYTNYRHNWCLPVAQSACSGGTGSTTPAPTTTPGSCLDIWKTKKCQKKKNKGKCTNKKVKNKCKKTCEIC